MKLTHQMQRVLDIIRTEGFAAAGTYVVPGCASRGEDIAASTLKALEARGLVELYTHQDGGMAARFTTAPVQPPARIKLWLVTFATIQRTQTAVSLGATAEEAIDHIRKSCAIPGNAGAGVRGAVMRESTPRFTATEITEGWRYV
jgi:hypothetical protein